MQRLCPTRRLPRLSVYVFLTLAWTATGAAAAVEGYANYETFRKQVDALDASDLVSVTVLGKTSQQRDVVLLTIARGKSENKPAILIVGNVHAPHLVGGEMVMRLAKHLVDHADDDAVKAMLDRVTLYLVPRPSPDATEAFFAQPSFEREGNARPTDDDRDFETNEDGPDDLDGNGVITMMRVEDPAGRWMPHPDDPRVLIEADPKKNEAGKYTLYTEGRDNDEDEAFNEDGPGGVSFNRNFTFNYPYFKPGAGPHQVSEPETRAVADFAFARTNIAVVISFTPEDNLFHPWKPDGNRERQRIKTTLMSDDAPFQDFIAERYRAIHGGKNAPSSPKGEGSFSEWAYFHYGRWSFAARGWWVPAEEEKKRSDEKRGKDDINALRWLEANKIDGFVEWKAIEHPDFKGRKVEVGGFKPYVLLNPPVKELDVLTENHAAWLGEVAGLLPKIQISEAKVESLGGSDEPNGPGVYRVTVTVINHGYLPTMSEMGRISRQLNPLQLAIELPEGASLVQGAPRTQLDVIKGKGGTAEHVYLVKAAKGLSAKLKVWSPSVGEYETTITLKEGE